MKACSSVRSRGIGFLWLVLGASFALTPLDADSHPMGNFSISHYAGIHIENNSIEVRYILDMAEIPTFQEMQQAGIVAEPTDPAVLAYLRRKAEDLRVGLTLSLNSRSLALETVSENVIFPPGAGGLPTMKIGILYRVSLADVIRPGELSTLSYHDGNYSERAGWKEVMATAAPGLTLISSTAAAKSRSEELSNYPTDFINSPPQDLSAQLMFTLPVASPVRSGSTGPTPVPPEHGSPPAIVETSVAPTDGKPVPAPATSASESNGGVARARTVKTNVRLPGCRKGGTDLISADKGCSTFSIAPGNKVGATGLKPSAYGPPSVGPAPRPSQSVALQANKQGTPSNRFTQLIASNQWGFWFFLTAALIAAALGGLHALEPGHGKTIVAAYLVGSQGTAAHALLLGLIVTATHTAGVYALGVITLYASKYIVPDHLYPWLGMASGLTIAGLGAYMLRRRYLGHHGHHHQHDSMDLGHDAGHTHYHAHVHTDVDYTHGPVYHRQAHHEHAHSHGFDHMYEHGHAHGHTHAHGHHHHEHSNSGSFSCRQLALLGVTGGIIPCPAALVVLLSAVSLHRVAFGLYLILAFSLGLAAVLISIGLITVYARRLLARVPSDGPVVNRWLPMASAAVITCLGFAITLQGLSAMGVIRIRL